MAMWWRWAYKGMNMKNKPKASKHILSCGLDRQIIQRSFHTTCNLQDLKIVAMEEQPPFICLPASWLVYWVGEGASIIFTVHVDSLAKFNLKEVLSYWFSIHPADGGCRKYNNSRTLNLKIQRQWK